MTSIAWTDVTDNIIKAADGGWWCRKISAGCANCYAESLNQNKFFGGNQLSYSGNPPELILRDDILKSWARQTKSKKHFVASMTDVFGEWVNPNSHYQMFDAMSNAPKQIFQLLTKRPEVMRQACFKWLALRNLDKMPDNIWLGVTCENQQTADTRIPVLEDIPAHIRFLSCEPLLENIDLNPIKNNSISWVIIGGESGSKARPCNLEWIWDLVAQCYMLDIAVFVKQLGENSVTSSGSQFSGTSKKNDNILDFPEALRIQIFPTIYSKEADMIK